MEHERQMDWQVKAVSSVRWATFIRVHIFEYELRRAGQKFLGTQQENANYYAYIRSSDDAQHMDRDILSLL